MWIFYAFAACMLAVGGIIWFINHNKIIWQEWLIGGFVAFFLAFFAHSIAYSSAVSDYQIISGSIQKVILYPEWVERYTVVVTQKVGKTTTTRTEVRYRTHYEYYEAFIPALDRSITINKSKYEEFKEKLGNKIRTETPYKSGFHSGDRNIYITNNTSDVTLPYACNQYYENKVKAAPSLWQHQIPQDTKHLFEYPYVKNEGFQTDRLLGVARNHFSPRDIDSINARLGPSSRVNLIIIGYPKDTSIQNSFEQEGYWIGGKKNDLVITYAGDHSKIQWVRVFGWTEEEIVKLNIASIIMKNGLTNCLPEIEKEIKNNYKIKDWKKFDYLTIEPTTHTIVFYFIIQTIVQIGLWFYFHINEFNNEEKRTYYNYNDRRNNRYRY